MIKEIFLEREVDGIVYYCGMDQNGPCVAINDRGNVDIIFYDNITTARARFWELVKYGGTV